MGFDDSPWGSEPSPHGAVQGRASFEAVLKQLEGQGFRHVPGLLAETSASLLAPPPPAQTSWASTRSVTSTSWSDASTSIRSSEIVPC
jgi:hypothetical protein